MRLRLPESSEWKGHHFVMPERRTLVMILGAWKDSIFSNSIKDHRIYPIPEINGEGYMTTRLPT